MILPALVESTFPFGDHVGRLVWKMDGFGSSFGRRSFLFDSGSLHTTFPKTAASPRFLEKWREDYLRLTAVFRNLRRRSPHNGFERFFRFSSLLWWDQTGEHSPGVKIEKSSHSSTSAAQGGYPPISTPHLTLGRFPSFPLLGRGDEDWSSSHRPRRRMYIFLPGRGDIIVLLPGREEDY